MPKKQHLKLQRSEDFRAVDAELTGAMQALDETNARIDELLEELAPGEDPDEPAQSARGEARPEPPDDTPSRPS